MSAKGRFVKQVTEDIYLISIPQVFDHSNTASYLIKGDKVALIEAAFGSSLPYLEEAFHEVDAEVGDLDYIFTTHFHIDHTSAIGSLLERNQKAKLVVNYGAWKVVLDPVRMVRGAKPVFGDLVRIFGPMKPIDPDRVIKISGGEVFDLGEGVRLRLIYTPGHERDHTAIYEESTRTLFPGEAVCLYNPEELPVFLPPCSGGMYEIEQAKRSLMLLRELKVEHICTPHFGVVEMDPNKYFDENLKAIDFWYREIDNMLKQGLNYPEIVERCREITLNLAGYTSVEELHEYFGKYWFPIMVKLMVIGFMTIFLWRF